MFEKINNFYASSRAFLSETGSCFLTISGWWWIIHGYPCLHEDAGISLFPTCALHMVKRFLPFIMPLIKSEHYEGNRFDSVEILRESQGNPFENCWYITAVRPMNCQTDTDMKLAARKFAVFHSLHCTEKCPLRFSAWGVLRWEKKKTLPTLAAGDLQVHAVLWALVKDHHSHKRLCLPLLHCSCFQA